MPKRLFVADPVCALSFGHNLTLLRWYMSRYEGVFDQIYGAVARPLPANADPAGALLRTFSFLYHAEMPLPDSPWATPRGRKLRRIWLRENRALRRFLSRKLRIPLMTDPLAIRARTDWSHFWRKHGIGQNDAILLPGADYYATRALLRLLRKLPPSATPRVHLRFMNVLEHAAGGGSIDLIARDLMLHGRVGERLTISAETDAYARFLSARIQFPVTTIAHPIGARLEKPADGSFTVACLGSGRVDKGFMRLADIIEQLAGMDGSARIRYVIQSVNPNARDFSSCAHERLASLPGVELLPHSITAEEMRGHYARADLCLLPYCPETYAMRGSAVVPEAIAAGCLLVASENTGFAPIVAACGGLLATRIEDFASAILSMATQSRATRLQIAEKAYQNYDNMFAASMDTLDRCLRA